MRSVQGHSGYQAAELGPKQVGHWRRAAPSLAARGSVTGGARLRPLEPVSDALILAVGFVAAANTPKRGAALRTF